MEQRWLKKTLSEVEKDLLDPEDITNKLIKVKIKNKIKAKDCNVLGLLMALKYRLNVSSIFIINFLKTEMSKMKLSIKIVRIYLKLLKTF